MRKKKCTKCGLLRDLLHFHNSKRYSDGKVQKCKFCIKKYSKAHYASNVEKHKEYNLLNIINRNVYHKNYRINNRERFAAVKSYRIRTEPEFKIQLRIRTRIWNALQVKKLDKKQKTILLLGCSIEFLKKYLENKFLPGMTWENHSLHGWHIDHIIPCSLFDLSLEEQQFKCFHYSNLQPLWAIDNLKKSNKLIPCR